VITVFCFGFVMMHPSPNLNKTAASSTTPVIPETTDPHSQLTALPMAEQASLTKLDAIPASNPASAQNLMNNLSLNNGSIDLFSSNKKHSLATAN